MRKLEEFPISMRKLKGLHDYWEYYRVITTARIIVSWYDKLYKNGYTSIEASRIVLRAKKMYNL